LLSATGAGVGYFPFASGSFGSLLGIPLALVLTRFVTSVPLVLLALSTAVVFACWVAGEADVLLGEHDSKKIVIDEIVGMWIALALLPQKPIVILTAFLLFRFFDIVKPWPAGYFDEEFPGGSGVVLDDVFAGIYAGLAAWLLV
jgi:phosphatidylglycerophosphatase A